MLRTVKWLKDQLANLPDDAGIVIDKEEITIYTQPSIHVIAAWEGPILEFSEDSLEEIEIDIPER